MSENYFTQLYNVDLGEKIKLKGNLKYLSWAAAWAEVKKRFPDTTYKIYEEILTVSPTGLVMKSRPWFDDGRWGWVKTGVTINGIECIEELPILNNRNQPIAADAITSADANRTIQRSLTKAIARHGLCLYIYEGEDIPEESKELEKLRNACYKLVCDKAKISSEAKEKVAAMCKAADENANGNPKLMEDIDVLKELKTKLMAIR